ncbi:MAG: hypothetical protein J0H83_03465 [Candidatus Melainabacteria bacterium]|nr:hypothetical protein [Candidatus Melainabacteria bacterium]
MIEMLTAMMLTGFIAAATCDMMAALGIVSLKADNQLSSTLQCKRAIDMIGKQIRMSKNLYSPSFGVAGKVISSQTLVLFVPVVERKDKGGTEGLAVPNATADGESFDVFAYEVMPDKNRPGTGEFVLQRTLLLQGNRTLYSDSCPFTVGVPQTIAKGIIGPQDLSTVIDPVALNYSPKVFAYLRNTLPSPISTPVQPNTFPELNTVTADGGQVSGVAVQMEIQPSDHPNQMIRNTTFGLRSEFFTRALPYVN